MFFAVMLSWVAAAVAIALLASRFVNLRGDDPKLAIFATMACAVVVGIAYSMISGTSMSAWSVWSFMWACIGAVAGVAVWHLVRSRSITHQKFTARRSY